MSTDYSGRLSRSVIPSHYDLTIRTDLKRQTFAGTCEILLDIHESMPSITLHAGSPFKLSSAVLAQTDGHGKVGELRKSLNIRIDEAKQRAEITFEGGEISQGTYKLGCKWEGALATSTVGYFCASFVPPGESEDKKEYYTMTQFQPCMSLPSILLESVENLTRPFPVQVMQEVHS